MLRHRTRLTLAALMLIALCSALVVVDTIRTLQERQTALAAARAQAAGLAYSLAEQAEGVMLAADAILVGLRERIETDGTGPAALARLQRVAAARAVTIKTLYGFYAYDGQGRWLINPAPRGVPAYSIADRAYFIHHRDDRSRDLWIGVPLVSRSSGRWVFTLSLRVDRPDGSFGGVVAAAIDIERMQTFYGSLGLGPHGVVALFRGDGQLLLRHPLVESRLGVSAPNRSLMSQLAGQGGDIEWASPYDGVRRVIGYRRLDSFPMVVLAGIGRDEALAGWRRDAISHLLGALTAAGVGVTVGLVLLLRASRRRHAAELAAAAADSEYRMLAEHATDMILRVQEGGRRIYASPASWTLLGYSPQQMLLRRAADDIHPDDLRQAAPAEWADPGQPGDGTTRSYRMRRADGRHVWVEVTLRPLPDEAGRPCETLVVVRDITARQQVAARLLEANRLLRRAEALAGIGHWRVELASRAIFWSDEMRRIYGWPPDRAVYLDSAVAAYHPDDQAEVVAKLQHTIETGAPLQFELRLVRPDGATRHVAARGEAEYAESGEMTAVVGTLQDVTESRALQTELLHRQKLEAVGQLAAGVAHDFNNMLQGVLGCLELIIDQATPGSDLATYADVAFKSADRGAALTQQLLSFARKQTLEPRPVAMAPFLEELHTLLERTLGPHVTIEVAVATGLPDLLVDPSHLHTALINLALNASQAMPEGGRLRIEVFAEPASDQAERCLVVAVADTGPGMDAATLARATDPFFTTKGPTGTGLGLPMVQGFARQSGGDLRLSSVLGKGTRAEIVLPCPAVASQQAEAPPRPPRRSASRVLLVDDVADVTFTAGRFLEKAGMRVTTAESGDAAMAVLASGARFDVLVTDYAMPGMNGVDLVTLARELQPGLPALIMTGFAAVDTDRISRVAAVLRKPFRQPQLVDAILDLLPAASDSEAPPANDPAFDAWAR